MHLLVAIEKHLKGFCHDLVHVNELLVQFVNVLSRIHILKLFLLSDDDSLCSRGDSTRVRIMSRIRNRSGVVDLPNLTKA